MAWWWPWNKPKWVEHTIDVGARARTYQLYVPKNVPEPTALVVAFHGGAVTDPMGFADTVGLKALADERKWIVALPYGLVAEIPNGKRSWNVDAVPEAEQGWHEANNIDDVGFLEDMLAEIKDDHAIGRTYALGHSKGGMLILGAQTRLGCFNAVAGNACTIASEIQSTSIAAGCSRLHIHGTADENVPYEGGGINTNWPPVEPGLVWWMMENDCGLPTPWVWLNEDAKETHADAPSGVRVQRVSIHDWGHAWPPGATTFIADFFAAH